MEEESNIEVAHRKKAKMAKNAIPTVANAICFPPSASDVMPPRSAVVDRGAVVFGKEVWKVVLLAKVVMGPVAVELPIVALPVVTGETTVLLNEVSVVSK